MGGLFGMWNTNHQRALDRWEEHRQSLAQMLTNELQNHHVSEDSYQKTFKMLGQVNSAKPGTDFEPILTGMQQQATLHPNNLGLMQRMGLWPKPKQIQPVQAGPRAPGLVPGATPGGVGGGPKNEVASGTDPQSGESYGPPDPLAGLIARVKDHVGQQQGQAPQSQAPGPAMGGTTPPTPEAQAGPPPVGPSGGPIPEGRTPTDFNNTAAGAQNRYEASPSYAETEQRLKDNHQTWSEWQHLPEDRGGWSKYAVNTGAQSTFKPTPQGEVQSLFKPGGEVPQGGMQMMPPIPSTGYGFPGVGSYPQLPPATTPQAQGAAQPATSPVQGGAVPPQGGTFPATTNSAAQATAPAPVPVRPNIQPVEAQASQAAPIRPVQGSELNQMAMDQIRQTGNLTPVLRAMIQPELDARATNSEALAHEKALRQYKVDMGPANFQAINQMKNRMLAEDPSLKNLPPQQLFNMAATMIGLPTMPNMQMAAPTHETNIDAAAFVQQYPDEAKRLGINGDEGSLSIETDRMTGQVRSARPMTTRKRIVNGPNGTQYSYDPITNQMEQIQGAPGTAADTKHKHVPTQDGGIGWTTDAEERAGIPPHKIATAGPVRWNNNVASWDTEDGMHHSVSAKMPQGVAPGPFAPEALPAPPTPPPNSAPPPSTAKPNAPQIVNKYADKQLLAANKQMDVIAKPVTELSARLSRFNETMAAGGGIAHAVAVPEFLTIMAGGTGTGLRMTDTELNRIFGGTTKRGEMKNLIEKWMGDESSGNLLLTPEQQHQMTELVKKLQQKAQWKQELIDMTRDRMPGASVTEQQRAINFAKAEIARIDKTDTDKYKPMTLPAVSAGGGSNGTGGKIVVIAPDGSEHPMDDEGHAKIFEDMIRARGGKPKRK